MSCVSIMLACLVSRIVLVCLVSRIVLACLVSRIELVFHVMDCVGVSSCV